MRRAIIMDLDGTLCDGSDGLGRPGYHEYATTEAPPNPEMLAVCRRAKLEGTAVIIVSGREAFWLSASRLWVQGVGVGADEFHFRANTDWRPNPVVKREIAQQLQLRYDVVAAYDDDPRNLKVFKMLGIPKVVKVGQFDRRLV